MLLAHQAHGFIAELRGVVDGGNASLRGVERAGFAHGVDGNARAQAAGFFNGGGQFGLGVLVGRMQSAVNHAVGAGLVDFREVGAFLVLRADDRDELVCGVGVVGVGENVLRGIEAVGVFVAAEDINGVAADAQAGARDEALVDSVANGCVGRSLRLRCPCRVRR